MTQAGQLFFLDEDSSESNLAAEMCLDAINNILRAELQDEVYQQVSTVILELFDMSLLSNSPTCLEKSLSYLNIVISKLDGNLPDSVLFYFPLLCYLATGFPHAAQTDALKGKIPDRSIDMLKKLPPKQYPIFNPAYLLSPMLNFLQICSKSN